MSLESRLTERQFFLLSLGGLLLLLVTLYAALLRPQFQQHADLRRKVDLKTRELREAGYLLGEAPLQARKRALEREYERLLGEWETARDHLSTFGDRDESTPAEVGHIDYKVRLYLTRDRLRDKAASQKIDVPALLGLPDTLDSDDVAREKMLQLRAVELLVDTAIEYGIADIRGIDPLPPVVHAAGAEDTVYLEEYPLRVRFEGDMRGLYRLWEAMFQPGRAMLLRNIAMEKTSLRHPDAVRMTATLSSFLFLEEAENVDPARERNPAPTAAKGH